MISLNKKCSKKNCNDLAVYKWSNTNFYCPKHFRFFRICNLAQTNKKYQPTFEELEHLLIQCGPKMKCLKCNKIMIWHNSEGTFKDLITLQHNCDQSIELICYSCNCFHANHTLKDNCFNISKEYQYCSKCQMILSKIEFHKNKHTKNNIQHLCKKCRNQLNKIRQQKRKSMGLCKQCPNKISKNSISICDQCLEKNRQKNKERKYNARFSK